MNGLWTTPEVATVILAVLAAVVSVIGIAWGIIHFLVKSRSAGDRTIHVRLDDAIKEMPKDFVPRLELNGRLDTVNNSIGGVQKSVDEVHSRFDDVLNAIAGGKKR